MQTLLSNNPAKLDRPQPAANPRSGSREATPATDDRFRSTLRSATTARESKPAATDKPQDEVAAAEEPRNGEAVDADETTDVSEEKPAEATEDTPAADANPVADDDPDQEDDADVTAAEVAGAAGVVKPREEAGEVGEDGEAVTIDGGAAEAESSADTEPAEKAAAATQAPAPAGGDAQETPTTTDQKPAVSADQAKKPEDTKAVNSAVTATQSDPAAAASESDGDGAAGEKKQSAPAATAMGQAKLAPEEVAAAGKVEANKPAALAPATDAADDQPAVRAMGPMQTNTAANASPTNVGAALDAPRQVVEQGVDATVTAVRTMNVGGKQQHAMTLRLDPPQLGSMRVNVQMVDGQLTATFSAGSEVAHRLLQQNLPQLKAGLEQAGFNVDRLNVQRTPPAQQAQDGQFHQQQNQDGQPREQMQQHQRDQQRRETLSRIWRRGGFDGERTNLVA